MKIFQVFRYLAIDPVNFSVKAKILSLIACFCAIFFIALTTRIISPWPGYPMIVASMGASAIILFFIPGSPLAQPWPFVGGQLVSAFVGVFCALNISETSTAAASAVGGSILMMLMMRCLHPPGAATSLTPIMAGTSITSLGYSFVLVPVAVNVVSMLLLAIIINRWIMAREYPSPLPIKKKVNQRHTMSAPSHQIGFSEQDLEQTLKESDVFIDMTHAELSHVLSQVEINSFKRIKGRLLCADIMVRDVMSVEYGTEVEHAWRIMRGNNLKAMPVVDTANRVIGIITWNNFFKYIDLDAYESFQDEFHRFIRRTPGVMASKPESVGFIMTSSVVTLADTAHIAELITLMSIQGHRQVPIVNSEQRLVGMVYQANLIAALYNDELARKDRRLDNYEK
ncbi:MAG: CBS domain-containing protein [Gammaproteobacteria bacterium]|jgi:CBS domain-containing membrane protein|nr:CBS domain-containing protein [Gammaproteobacteria bacterium]MBT5221930.1 CBS domain-containing protein [Gammaproteobacteria bacterium]MBT5826025.1 CBS domain-containing protein [Gammaproteobacteria bacterium]MBT6418948.1 CBS domain-containing protein [Gammaproteobacteria bacterium]MBT6576300.1 CBS domain-containing protein [Gammaproteobacteria bacterium]